MKTPEVGIAQVNLFGQPELTVRHLKDCDGRRIDLIGITKGRKCKECSNFYHDQRGKVYRRCKLYPSKSWKANFEACGRFEGGE